MSSEKVVGGGTGRLIGTGGERGRLTGLLMDAGDGLGLCGLGLISMNPSLISLVSEYPPGPAV